jgi:hypothetical protein
VARTRPKLRRLSHSESLIHIEEIRIITATIGEKYVGKTLDYVTKRQLHNEIEKNILEYVKNNGLIHENGAYYVEEEY